MVATIPNPDTTTWTNGDDPHSLTAYTSPFDQRPYAIVDDDVGAKGVRTWLAIVDLPALLDRNATPRTSEGHIAANALTTCTTGSGPGGTNGNATNSNGCVVRFVAIPK